MSSLSLPQLIVEYLIDSPICEHPYLTGSRAEFINFSAAPPLTNSWSFLQSCGSIVPAHYPISALFKSSQWPATLFQISHLQTVPHSWPPSPLLHCTFENLRHFLCLFSWPYIQKTSELPCKTSVLIHEWWGWKTVFLVFSQKHKPKLHLTQQFHSEVYTSNKLKTMILTGTPCQYS